MSNTTPLLEIRNLSVNFGNDRILQDVNLDVMPGSIHALIGPNGAGKTTLIRAIMGGMPHKGQIVYNFRGNGKLGYVPQILEFDRYLPITVADFFNMMLSNRPAFFGSNDSSKKMILSALSRTRCESLIDRQIGGLSGGEIRRVLLAQALAPLPEFLVLDEPASNVDEVGAAQFEALLMDLREKHRLTVLMVAHDSRMVERVADRVTALNRKIVYDGDPSALNNSEMMFEIFGMPIAGKSDSEVTA